MTRPNHSIVPHATASKTFGDNRTSKKYRLTKNVERTTKCRRPRRINGSSNPSLGSIHLAMRRTMICRRPRYGAVASTCNGDRNQGSIVELSPSRRESRSGAHTLHPNRRMSHFVVLFEPRALPPNITSALQLCIPRMADIALLDRLRRQRGTCAFVIAPFHKLHNRCRSGCSRSVQSAAATTVSVRVPDSNRSTANIALLGRSR